MRGKAMVVLISTFSRLGVNEYGIFRRRENLEALQKLRCVKRKRVFSKFRFLASCWAILEAKFPFVLAPISHKKRDCQGERRKKGD